jgi:hypothetical protein
MRTLIIVGLATALNVGLWICPRPLPPPHANASNVAAAQCDSPASAARTAASPSAAASNSAPLKAKAGLPGASPDQPWLNTVRDGVLQMSLTPRFTDKVLISAVECKGSECEITGSTKQRADGQWEGSSAVADLFKAMGDGEIAGGDTHRAVLMNQIQSAPGGNGSTFSLTVEQHDGAPFRNPCQSILDMWKASHPEDFKNNPLMPTIKNYSPRSISSLAIRRYRTGPRDGECPGQESNLRPSA